MAEVTYVRKITASLGWLRNLMALTDPQTGEIIRPESPACPVMRIKCEVEDGWGEVGPLGDYIRFEGKFMAHVVQRDGTMRVYVARNAIFPKIAEDIIAAEMEMKHVDTKVRGRDGRYYSTRKPATSEDGAAGAEIMERWAGVIDMWIAPPPADKPTTTGYVFDIRVPWQAQRFDTMQHIGSDLGEFSAPALPAPEAPAAEHVDAPVAEHEAEAGHETESGHKGRRGHRAA